MRWLLLLPLLLLPTQALAQGQLLSYSLKPAVQKGEGYPQVYLQADSDFRRVELICERSDGGEVKLSAGATKRGKKPTFDLKQPEGTFTYRCEARGHYGTGEDEFFDLYFNFEAFLGGGLTITVPREQIDLKLQSLVATADRTVSAAHLTLIGPDGPFFDQDLGVDENDPGDELEFEWEGRDIVLRMDLTLTDKWGFYSFENIFPWSLEIPHDDILFDTGSHTITADEQPKLNSAWTEVDKVVRRYSQYVEVRLYIAGYTDTVGDRSSNQGLSERRARAISEAFQKKGFKGPVYYQGFGEDGLAITTPDSTDEIANRRAVYLLASRPPPGSPQFPRGSWKKLQ